MKKDIAKYFGLYGGFLEKKYLAMENDTPFISQFDKRVYSSPYEMENFLINNEYKLIYSDLDGRTLNMKINDSTAEIIEDYLVDELEDDDKYNERIDGDYEDVENYYLSKDKKVLLKITYDKKGNFFLRINYIVDSECAKKLFDHINSIPLPDRKKQFYMIIARNDQLILEPFPIKDVNIDFNNYYNDDFDYNKLEKIINNRNKNGIIMFSGLPGTGKSSLIKYLVSNTDKEFCFLPTGLIELFSNPKSLEFVVNYLNKKIIVIEDCEEILKSRDFNGSKDISTILNITDGLLGDFLEIKIIVTFNTKDKIDSALTRKGRNLFSYEFGKLVPEKANAVAKSIGLNVNFSEETPLCDIFNYDDEVNSEFTDNKNKRIGF